MRVRILRKPSVTEGMDDDSLAVGRVYNLPSAVGSALMLEGYAELYDALTPAEKRARTEEASHVAWTAEDHPQRWAIVNGNKQPR